MDGDGASILFARNLRRLCERDESISAVASSLGVNRQQFARYLNGEMVPRASILDKISTYFDVPVSSLFEDNESDVSGGWQIPDTLSAFLGSCFQQDVPEKMLPSGFYVQYKNSFLAKSVLCQLVYVFRRDGVTHLKKKMGKRVLSKLPIAANVRQVEGIALVASENVLFLNRETRNGEMSFYVLRKTGSYEGNYKPGIQFAVGSGSLIPPAATLLCLERIEDPKEVWAQARRQGLYDIDDIPLNVQRFLTTTKDGPNIPLFSG